MLGALALAFVVIWALGGFREAEPGRQASPGEVIAGTRLRLQVLDAHPARSDPFTEGSPRDAVEVTLRVTNTTAETVPLGWSLCGPEAVLELSVPGVRPPRKPGRPWDPDDCEVRPPGSGSSSPSAQLQPRLPATAVARWTMPGGRPPPWVDLKVRDQRPYVTFIWQQRLWVADEPLARLRLPVEGAGG